MGGPSTANRRTAPGARTPKRPRCAASGYKKGRGLRETPEDAAPHLFTFLRYPGMAPHNNAAERGIRDAIVLHRSVRHQLSEPGGRHMFSVRVSVARTCQKLGMAPQGIRRRSGPRDGLPAAGGPEGLPDGGRCGRGTADAPPGAGMPGMLLKVTVAGPKSGTGEAAGTAGDPAKRARIFTAGSCRGRPGRRHLHTTPAIRGN